MVLSIYSAIDGSRYPISSIKRIVTNLHASLHMSTKYSLVIETYIDSIFWYKTKCNVSS